MCLSQFLFLEMSSPSCKIHFGQYLLQKFSLPSFPEQIKKSFLCLTSVPCTYVCGSMGHILLKFPIFTVSVAHALSTFVFQYLLVPKHCRRLKNPHKPSQSPYRCIRQLPELSTRQKNNKEVITRNSTCFQPTRNPAWVS